MAVITVSRASVCWLLAFAVQAAAQAPATQSGPPNTAGAPGPVYHVGNGVSQPILLSKVEPVYSQLARKLVVEGFVDLYAVIAPDGSPRNLRVLRSIGFGLDDKAIEAVAHWKFKPGYKDGNPVSVAATVQVNFRLMDGPRVLRWHTVGMGFARDNGATPPEVEDGIIPKSDKNNGRESAVFEFTVTTTGAVTDIRSLQSSGAGAEALAHSLGQWKFRPAFKAGMPVVATARVRFLKGPADASDKAPLFPNDAPAATNPPNADAADFSRPRVLQRVEAEYTDAARDARIGGTVTLQIVVGADGEVTDAKVTTSLGHGLDEKALEAVRKWKFQAARRDGQPVAASMTVEFKFRAF
jgi:TonB family protein